MSEGGRDQITIVFGERSVAANVARTDRRVLKISVRPSGDVDVFAPRDAAQSDIERRVSRKKAWVFNQIDFLAKSAAPTPARRFVSGESHLLLGRQYRLSVARSANPEVRLDGSRLCIFARDPDDSAHCRRLLTAFQNTLARTIFRQRLDAIMPPFRRRGMETPHLIIRKMRKRWGSYTPSGGVVLNVDLVRASPLLIDYVICHELAHAFYADHRKEWRELVEAVMPDWELRKARLEAVLR